MLDNLKKYNIVLASQSPRRRSLLKELGIDFTCTTVDVEEVFPDDLSPEEVAIFLAELKAGAFNLNEDENTLLITADTIVCLNNEILGKPANYEDGAGILRKLSGRCHDVITGVCLKSSDKTTSFFAKTEVHFKELSDGEISHYLNHYKPYDKAGSYGIQEWIGFIGIDKIEGSFYNVMGLPTQMLYRELLGF